MRMVAYDPFRLAQSGPAIIVGNRWPVVRTQAISGRYPATGLLDLGAPHFLRRFAGWKRVS